MFQQIMVPLDGSELAERALPCAARLGVATGATLHLVHVVELMPPPTGPFALAYMPSGIHGDLVAQETQQATEYLAKMRERVAANGVPVRTEQMLGIAAAALLDYESDAGIDLVVLCSHGRTGLARFALGSVAEHLLRHGTAPVLLVIGAAQEGPEAERYLDEAARRLTQEHLACSQRVAQGDPAETIIEVAGT